LCTLSSGAVSSPEHSADSAAASSGVKNCLRLICCRSSLKLESSSSKLSPLICRHDSIRHKSHYHQITGNLLTPNRRWLSWVHSYTWRLSCPKITYSNATSTFWITAANPESVKHVAWTIGKMNPCRCLPNTNLVVFNIV
jgi:hypothetical protein